jgi:hypothetical protein
MGVVTSDLFLKRLGIFNEAGKIQQDDLKSSEYKDLENRDAKPVKIDSEMSNIPNATIKGN